MRGLGPGGFHERAARRLEREGDLSGAVESYLEAGLRNEAARVLMLRADAEASLERRMAFFEQAAAAAEDEAVARSAKARRAKLFYDLVRQKGTTIRSEILVAAKQLEEASELIVAAEAFALAGDAEGEIRCLTGAGAIDRLEERLARDAAAAKADSEQVLALKRVQDLDRGAERRRALETARAAPADERVADLVREIRQRIVRGPTARLTVSGKRLDVALGDSVTVGRGDATILVASPALSRIHLRLFRGPSGEPLVSDEKTRNGTFLKGARLAGPIPIGAGLELRLGTDVPCSLEPVGEGIAVKLFDVAFVAPLGPLRIGAFTVVMEGEGEAAYVVLESTAEHPAFRGSLELARKVELCLGDEIAASRGGAPLLVVGGGAEGR